MATTNKSDALPIVADPMPATRTCWSCGDMRAAHFCNACGKLQPAAPTDYFSFFGLPRKLNLDTAALEQEFYKLSRKLHPDLYARATGQEQNWSLEKTSQLNDAYRTLRDPIARTEYLLRLEGLHFEEQSKAATDAARLSGGLKQQAIPPELLEEVFEINMHLEEARMNRKMGEADPDLARQLQETKSNLESKYGELDAELRRYWNEWDAVAERVQGGEVDAVPGDGRKRLLERLVSVLNRRTYIRNLVRDVNEVLDL